MDLSEIRGQIDAYDYSILEILSKRLDLSSQIAKIKKERNLPITDNKREIQAISDRISKFESLGYHDDEFISNLFTLIFNKSKNLQEDMDKK